MDYVWLNYVRIKAWCLFKFSAQRAKYNVPGQRLPQKCHVIILAGCLGVLVLQRPLIPFPFSVYVNITWRCQLLGYESSLVTSHTPKSAQYTSLWHKHCIPKMYHNDHNQATEGEKKGKEKGEQLRLALLTSYYKLLYSSSVNQMYKTHKESDLSTKSSPHTPLHGLKPCQFGQTNQSYSIISTCLSWPHPCHCRDIKQQR